MGAAHKLCAFSPDRASAASCDRVSVHSINAVRRSGGLLSCRSCALGSLVSFGRSCAMSVVCIPVGIPLKFERHSVHARGRVRSQKPAGPSP